MEVLAALSEVAFSLLPEMEANPAWRLPSARSSHRQASAFSPPHFPPTFRPARLPFPNILGVQTNQISENLRVKSVFLKPMRIEIEANGSNAALKLGRTHILDLVHQQA